MRTTLCSAHDRSKVAFYDGAPVDKHRNAHGPGCPCHAQITLQMVCAYLFVRSTFHETLNACFYAQGMRNIKIRFDGTLRDQGSIQSVNSASFDPMESMFPEELSPEDSLYEAKRKKGRQVLYFPVHRLNFATLS
jgi:hypothetical protein